MSDDATPAPSSDLAERRRRRLPIHGVLVAIDAPDLAAEHWVVDAIDINGGGMGLVLPPEVPQHTQVLLSFQLEESLVFSRVPARVQHREGVSGGVRFEPWPSDQRLALLEFLVAAYEHST